MRSEVTWPTIPAMVRDSAHRFGDSEAVVEGDRRVGFAELSALVSGAARALAASGIAPGEWHAAAVVQVRTHHPFFTRALTLRPERAVPTWALLRVRRQISSHIFGAPPTVA